MNSVLSLQAMSVNDEIASAGSLSSLISNNCCNGDVEL